MWGGVNGLHDLCLPYVRVVPVTAGEGCMNVWKLWGGVNWLHDLCLPYVRVVPAAAGEGVGKCGDVGRCEHVA